MLLAHPACIDGDTEVLTEYRGWVKLRDVKITDRVYDGVEFVSHNGCQLSGIKEVINRFGIDMTLDHKFLIGNEWKEAKDVSVEDERRGIFKYNGNDDYLSRMCQLQSDTRNVETKCFKSKQTWRQKMQGLYKRYLPQYDKHSYMENMERDEGALQQHSRQELRWTWYNLRQKVGRFQFVLQRYVGRILGHAHFGKNRCEFELHKIKLQMDKSKRATKEQADNSIFELQRRENSFSGISEDDRFKSLCFNRKIEQGNVSRRRSDRCEKFNLWDKKSSKKRFKEVYDLVDAGKRNRFLVRNLKGDMYISHNSAGHGLNLQKGGSTIVWYGFTWSLELYQQFNARLYRQGQEKPVRAFHIAVGDIEEKLMRALADKEVTQDKLLESLK